MDEPLEKPKKIRKHRKIRRLADNSTDNKENTSTITSRIQRSLKRFLVGTFLLGVALAVLLGNYYTQNNSQNKSVVRNFISRYRKNYNQIIHGIPNYCDQVLDTQTLFARIRLHNILHQEEALQHLEIALLNDTKLNAIAIVGTSGVGKSLFRQALEQAFPWRENVHTYAWNTFVEDEVQKFHIIRMFVENLSDCGRNLLIIENLAPCDYEVVPIVNKFISEDEDAKTKRVIIIYVFNLHTMGSTKTKTEARKHMLQHLPNTKTINFKQFGINELKDCIRREAAADNITLNKSDFDEIVATLDVTHSGCKNVHAKVSLYANEHISVIN